MHLHTASDQPMISQGNPLSIDNRVIRSIIYALRLLCALRYQSYPPHPSKRGIEHTDLSHSSEFFVALPPKSLSNPSTLTPPPTTLTGNETESLCAFDLHKSKCQPPKSLSNPSTLSPPPTTLTWQELNSNLQAVFPTDDTYTYIVENYQSKELETFPRAPGIAFDTQVPFLSQRFACKTDTSVGHYRWFNKICSEASYSSEITSNLKKVYASNLVPRLLPSFLSHTVQYATKSWGRSLGA